MQPPHHSRSTFTVLVTFAMVRDPRCSCSVVCVDSLPSLPALKISGPLANHPSVLAIAEWEEYQREGILN
jgi:hypothetical protein